MTKDRSDPVFQREVLSAFAFTSPEPLRVLYSDCDPGAFGNASIGLEGRHLRLRVRRDRGQILVDLSPQEVAADWFDEDVVVELMGGRTAAAHLETDQARSLQVAADSIRTYWPAIVERFRGATWPGTRQALRALQEARARRLFG